MKANEFRIDNLVDYKYGEELFYKIASIDEETVSLKDNISFDYIGYDEIEGIPLTEDWLIKFGFKKNETFCFINIESGIELMNIANKYFRGRYKGALITKDIEYVHQLQNLYFALTNKELTL
jgi:hypothetical protein